MNIRFSPPWSGLAVRLLLLASSVATSSARAQSVGEQFDTVFDQFKSLRSAGRDDEAERFAKGELNRAEAENLSVRISAWSYTLGLLYRDQGRLDEAEPMLRRGVTILTEALGADHPVVVESLKNLADVRLRQARVVNRPPPARGRPVDDEFKTRFARFKTLHAAANYDEAERIAKGGLNRAEAENRLGWIASWSNALGLLYRDRGRYAEAEPMLRRGLTILEKALGPDHAMVAMTLHGLGALRHDQGRVAEAESLLKRALAIMEKTSDPDAPVVADSLNNLAIIYRFEGRGAEAEPLLKRALEIRKKALGPDHPDVAMSFHNLAVVYLDQGRYAEAEPLMERTLEIREKALGPDHPDVAKSLHNLAAVYLDQDRYAEAESLFDRAVAIQDRAGVGPGDRFGSYHLRARLAWKTGRRGEAVADLRHALDMAERQRVQAAGGDWERARAFESFARAFERMVEWQTELGDVGEALQAIERSRARSLLDEINVGGTDLGIGRSAAEREALQKREGELRARVAELEKRAELEKDADARAKLNADLAAAREALYDHLRDVRSGSPVYRNLLSTGSGPPRLSQLQRALPADALMPVYLLGEEAGYVALIGSGSARIEKLEVPEAEAKTLGIEPGPFTAERARAALAGGDDGGLLAALASPKSEPKALAPKLAALWRVLLPAAEREAIRKGAVEFLAVVSDGPLSLLPFEALVVEEGAEPRYLLDVGPPTAYAPSATVFYNLASRSAPAARGEGREPVLSVGDPAYGDVGAADPAPESASALAALTSRSRFRTAAGRLDRLPFTDWETRWVAKGFIDAGVPAVRLTGPAATERGVRHWGAGREVLHLACHGLADQKYGNFFGALALTPGPGADADPADDGFLSLPEIYELDLKGTELTILSACQTNYGPQQRGEGTWALSRGFLVAGSRRVVASNWLVDDEAGASLVSYFCSGLARDRKAAATVDHARDLRDAKRWAKSQEKWRSPYYWASLVLVGPS